MPSFPNSTGPSHALDTPRRNMRLATKFGSGGTMCVSASMRAFAALATSAASTGVVWYVTTSLVIFAQRGRPLERAYSVTGAIMRAARASCTMRSTPCAWRMRLSLFFVSPLTSTDRPR